MNPQILWTLYNSTISNINVKKVLMLSAPCINMFSRLKLASVKNRFEKYCDEENKTNIIEILLNPEHNFDFNIESIRLQVEMNNHLEDCKVIEELAFVTSLGRELDSFIFLTAYNDLKTQTTKEN